MGVTALTFLGDVTSSVTWPIDPPYVISYWCPIGTESLSSTVFEIFASKYLGHDLDLSRSRDIIGHVTMSFPRCYFL